MKTVSSRNQGWSVAAQGLAVLAAGAGLGAAVDAEAGIIYTDIPDATIQNSSLPIDLDLDTTIDFTLSHTFLTDPSIYSVILSGNSSSSFMGEAADKPFAAKPFALDAGDPIGPVSLQPVPGTLDGGATFKPFWGDGTNAYLGVQFNRVTGNHFGWIHAQVDIPAIDPAANSKVTVFGYAYCDQPGGALLAGQTEGACLSPSVVPLPSGLALLATGAAAALILRRRGGKAS